jgi:hypothetical protein
MQINTIQFALKHIHTIHFVDVPLAWSTRFELFTPDLEQFPLMYVHSITEMGRVYGFPISTRVIDVKGTSSTIEVKFLCNIPEGTDESDSVIFEELSHRFGLANAVKTSQLNKICTGNSRYQSVLEEVWKGRIDKVYGNMIPHGRIYDEVFGLVRFSASGVAPKLGKTSELRMTYWFMKDMGQPVELLDECEPFNFCEFYLLPTKSELRRNDFSDFPNFDNLVQCLKPFWDSEFPLRFKLDDLDLANMDVIRSNLNQRNLPTKGNKKIDLWGRLQKNMLLEKAYIDAPEYRSTPSGGDELPNKAKKFEERYQAMFHDEFDTLDHLRHIFNRNCTRMYHFVWNLMTFIEHGYDNFTDRNDFKKILLYHHERKGFSSKVLACILQQCFGYEAMPIDTWVKTFVIYAFGFDPTDDGKGDLSLSNTLELYDNFTHLDKLEKIIWVSSMGNKTNKTEFEDILWCQRYGTVEGTDGPCRGANPLACTNCSLRTSCIGFERISSGQMMVSDSMKYLNAGMAAIYHGIQNSIIPPQSGIFGVLTENGVPRKAYLYDSKKTEFDKDMHSGYNFSMNNTISSQTLSVEDFVDHF